MAKKTPLVVAGRHFSSKKELREVVQEILHKYDLLVPINEVDFFFMYNFFLELYPDFEEKKGCGIDKIVVKEVSGWGRSNKHFQFIRTDQSTTDISFTHCFQSNKSKEKESWNMFNESARSAIRSQIIEYRDMHIKNTGDVNNTILCEKTNERIPQGQYHVDHIPPLTFDNIVKDFIVKNSINVFEIKHNGFGDNEVRKEFKDEELKCQFAEYHKSVAKLRVISKKENLSQSKVG